MSRRRRAPESQAPPQMRRGGDVQAQGFALIRAPWGELQASRNMWTVHEPAAFVDQRTI